MDNLYNLTCQLGSDNDPPYNIYTMFDQSWIDIYQGHRLYNPAYHYSLDTDPWHSPCMMIYHTSMRTFQLHTPYNLTEGNQMYSTLTDSPYKMFVGCVARISREYMTYTLFDQRNFHIDQLRNVYILLLQSDIASMPEGIVYSYSD